MLSFLGRTSAIITQSTRKISSMVVVVGQLTVTNHIESKLAQAAQLVIKATTNQNTALLQDTDQSERGPDRDKLVWSCTKDCGNICVKNLRLYQLSALQCNYAEFMICQMPQYYVPCIGRIMSDCTLIFSELRLISNEN